MLHSKPQLTSIDKFNVLNFNKNCAQTVYKITEFMYKEINYIY